ncbi:MAG: quinone-dependent dihydroorotate dehydrogenase [Opitutales bacterium]|nr:quinone-dependent dihydroorotate dehydrogenase [Opitutales bacterium]
MGSAYERVLRPILFRFSPEAAHNMSIRALQLAGACAPGRSLLRAMYHPGSRAPVKLWDLEFPNPVGIAAGMDKDALAVDGLFALGFGCVEVGTVTPLPQPGNPKPRLFRYPQHHAVVNRMGFNNAGAEAMAQRLARWRKQIGQRAPGILGVNLGKQKTTPLEDAAGDYLKSFSLLADLADYVAVNISSPNTPDLRKLQGSDYLGGILRTLNQANSERVSSGKRKIPLLLKIAPDLDQEQIEEIVGTVIDCAWDGIIATNTTIDRSPPYENLEKQGGLSGQPLRERSRQVLRQVLRATGGKVPVIGVGGIETADQMKEKLDAGAALIQVYTGFIYKGPGMVKGLIRA